MWVMQWQTFGKIDYSGDAEKKNVYLLKKHSSTEKRLSTEKNPSIEFVLVSQKMSKQCLKVEMGSYQEQQVRHKKMSAKKVTHHQVMFMEHGDSAEVTAWNNKAASKSKLQSRAHL